MKNSVMCLGFFWMTLAAFSFGCKKSAPVNNNPPVVNGVTLYRPVSVTKTNTKKVFVHLMPWFETKATNGGTWGVHWTMNTQNPDVIDSNGRRQIASHYYPLIGPYASGDTAVIQYQLLLMKLSGIDGVFIDWPGTQSKFDYPLLARNTERVVSQLAKVGLDYAMVYEDQDLAQATDQIAQAKQDLIYLQTNHFVNSNYVKLNNKPLLLDFGPQVLQSASDWTNVFSALNQKPAFFTLWFQSGKAGSNAAGEFAWIPQDNLNTLNAFYRNNYQGIKIGSAYPGFNSFYKEGGWAGPTWTIDYNGTGNFSQTLDLALSQNINYIQLATWNDYGEGTMIEPTREFGYSFLTALQQKLGVANLSQKDLEIVAQLYKLKIEKAGNADAQKKLNQVFYDLVSLQIDKASTLLASL